MFCITDVTGGSGLCRLFSIIIHGITRMAGTKKWVGSRGNCVFSCSAAYLSTQNKVRQIGMHVLPSILLPQLPPTTTFHPHTTTTTYYQHLPSSFHNYHLQPPSILTTLLSTLY